MKTRCLLFTGVGKVELSQTELPEPSADEIVVETLFSCISPGTELRCLNGTQEGLGTDHYPFIPGYSLVGRVIQADAAGTRPLGTLVFCGGARKAAHLSAWGGHIGHAVVPAKGTYPLPPGVKAEEACLLKLAAISHRGFLLSQWRPGEEVLVLGLGPIGQLSARLFSAYGASVTVADLATNRVALAEAQGLRGVKLEPQDTSALRAALPEGAPIVVDATGYPPALRTAIDFVSEKPWEDSDPPARRLVVQGSYAQDPVFPWCAAFARELTVLWPRDSQYKDLVCAGRLLAAGKLVVSDLISGVYPVAEAPGVYAELRSGSKALTTALFRW